MLYIYAKLLNKLRILKIILRHSTFQGQTKKEIMAVDPVKNQFEPSKTTRKDLFTQPVFLPIFHMPGSDYFENAHPRFAGLAFIYLRHI